MRDFTFGPDFQVEFSGPDSKYYFGSCTNLGDMYWRSAGALEGGAGAELNNHGELVLETTCLLSSADTGAFNNQGVISCPGHIETGRLEVNCWFTNQGAFWTETVLEIWPAQPDRLHFASGTVFDGLGLIRFPEGSRFSWEGTMNLYCTLEYFGDGTQGHPYWEGPGLFQWKGGGMRDFTFGPGFQVEFSGTNSKWCFGTCTNLGAMRWLTAGLLTGNSESVLWNDGLFQIESDGAWNGTVPFNNLANGTVRQLAGQFSMGTLNQGGTLTVEHGLLNATNLMSAPAGRYETFLSSHTPETGYHVLKADNLVLEGSLTVALTNGFIPTNGSSFNIVADSVRSGQFASTTLPPLQSNLLWQVRYLSDSVMLKVVQPFVLSHSGCPTNGSFQFTLGGPPAAAYDIQASTNLVDWFTIETNHPFSGLLIFTDGNATNLSRRFYRGRIFD
jgi:hypothetical protein